jgi:hypothetical protein
VRKLIPDDGVVLEGGGRDEIHDCAAGWVECFCGLRWLN